MIYSVGFCLIICRENIHVCILFQTDICLKVNFPVLPINSDCPRMHLSSNIAYLIHCAFWKRILQYLIMHLQTNGITNSPEVHSMLSLSVFQLSARGVGVPLDLLSGLWSFRLGDWREGGGGRGLKAEIYGNHLILSFHF